MRSLSFVNSLGVRVNTERAALSSVAFEYRRTKNSKLNHSLQLSRTEHYYVGLNGLTTYVMCEGWKLDLMLKRARRLIIMYLQSPLLHNMPTHSYLSTRTNINTASQTNIELYFVFRKLKHTSRFKKHKEKECT